MTTEIDIMLDRLQTALQGGLRIHNGVPYIHGVKAVYDEEKPMLECLSHYRCPHCDAHLSKDRFICLNGCHMTAPQKQKFDSEMVYHTNQIKIREKHFNVCPQHAFLHL